MAANAAAAHSFDFFSAYNSTSNKDILASGPWTDPLHELKTSSPLLLPCSKRDTSPSTKSHGTVMLARTGDVTVLSSDASTTKLTGLETKFSAVSTARTKTSFQLAYPPPARNSVVGRQRLKARPRLLLQLHHISASTRPTPALDVLPAIAFASVLARKFPAILKGKHGLGPNDLVIVGSEEYNTSGAGRNDGSNDASDCRAEAREVVATICQLPKDDVGLHGNTVICLEQGPSWVAKAMPNGCYDFVAVDNQGQQTIVRWVSRIVPSRRRSSASQSNSDAAPSERKFSFSIIDATTRRHPIIATLTRNALDILDEYPDLSSTAYPPSSLKRAFSSVGTGGPISNSSESHGRPMINTEDSLRRLIVVTGVWVAFREKWSKSFQYDDHIGSTVPSSPCSPSSRRCPSLSMSCRATSRTKSCDLQSHHLSGLHSESSSIARTDFDKLQGAPASASSVPRSNGWVERSGLHPRRANSTGSAFIQRANGLAGSANYKVSYRDPRMLVKEGDCEDNSMITWSRGNKVATACHSATLMPLVAGALQKNEEAMPQSSFGHNTDQTFPREKAMSMKEVGIHRDGKLELPEHRRWARIKGLFQMNPKRNKVW
ncbi:MAG: hypothetical protein M1812_004914 [Candelaria pacifica]|nr:MAG: hypothetical protein M1812_004914 [Candelaria pacifica]